MYWSLKVFEDCNMYMFATTVTLSRLNKKTTLDFQMDFIVYQLWITVGTILGSLSDPKSIQNYSEPKDLHFVLLVMIVGPIINEWLERKECKRIEQT